MAAGNMHRKFGEIWTFGFWDRQTDRQTNRHTDTLLTILLTPTGSKVIDFRTAFLD